MFLVSITISCLLVKIFDVKNLCIFNPIHYNIVSIQKPHMIFAKRIQDPNDGLYKLDYLKSNF